MTFTVSIDYSFLKKTFGKNVSQETFDTFCKDAITSALFEKQFMINTRKDKECIHAPDSKKLSPMSWPNYGKMPETVNCPTCGTICRR